MKGNYSQSSLFSDSIVASSQLAKICMCSPKTNTYGTLGSLMDTWSEKFELPDAQDTLPSCFSSHAVNIYPFHSLFSVIVLSLLCILLMILLFEWPPSAVAKMLASGPKYKKAVVWLIEKMHVLYKLWPGMSYSPVGCMRSILIC